MADNTPKLQPLPSSTASASWRGPLTVGVVEDSDEDFAVFSRGFRRHVATAQVERWDRAEAVLESLQTGRVPGEIRPDVLIVDLSLPGIDGAELVRRLRDHPATSGVPMFVLSGSARQRDIDRCYEAGADGYFRKSASKEELTALLDTILDAAVPGADPTPARDTPLLCVASARPRPRAWLAAVADRRRRQRAQPRLHRLGAPCSLRPVALNP